MSLSSIRGISSSILFTLRPKVGIAVGLFANLVVYLGWNIVLCAGCLGIDFNLSAYCSDRRSRLLYRDSSFASTYIDNSPWEKF